MGLDSFGGSESVNQPERGRIFKVLRLNEESVESEFSLPRRPEK